MSQEPATNSVRLLDEHQVAAWLSISVRTLRNWRVQGGQIPFIRVGRKSVRYRSNDVESWLDARVRTSTSDQSQGKGCDTERPTKQMGDERALAPNGDNARINNESDESGLETPKTPASTRQTHGSASRAKRP
jgi:excisionase family DNA binding protein